MFRVGLCVYFPSEYSRKHQHQPWRVALSWLVIPLGLWFPYHSDEGDCIKTSSNLFKDRHLPVCGPIPLKMQRSNPPPYELFREWTQGWIYRLPMCISGH